LAERIELVNRVVPARQLENAAEEVARKLAEKSPVALRIAKTLINRSMQIDNAAASDLEVLSAVVNSTSEDFQERIRAFNEKRKPVFKGK
jgi:2-(1,2-epoxy-1,2-dihydrophenyl)acetyl-CoA isomerase